MRQNSSSSNHSLKLSLLLALLPLLAGCGTVSYYGQAVAGHLEITCKRRDIDRLLADPATPPELARRLERVQDIRRFAVEELALPDSGSYRSYADLGREVTVWLVSAAPEFSLAAREWCYPFVGCLAYRGYFRRAGAERLAARLAAAGLETALSPAIAYSTLGFMDDPLLSPMLAYDDLELAGLIFHELAHERVFVAGDTRFNESFASAVERLGRARYAASRGLDLDPARERLRREREVAFGALLLELREELRAIYAGAGSAASRRARKRAALEAAAARYREFRDAWDGYRGFDGWFRDGAPNNAELALFGIYSGEVAAFEALFEAAGGDFERFHAAVEALGKLEPGERWRRLREARPDPVASP